MSGHSRSCQEACSTSQPQLSCLNLLHRPANRHERTFTAAPIRRRRKLCFAIRLEANEVGSLLGLSATGTPNVKLLELSKRPSQCACPFKPHKISYMTSMLRTSGHNDFTKRGEHDTQTKVWGHCNRAPSTAQGAGGNPYRAQGCTQVIWQQEDLARGQHHHQKGRGCGHHRGLGHWEEHNIATHGRPSGSRQGVTILQNSA